MLGGQPVVDGHDHGPGPGGDLPAHGVVRLEIADDPATAVEEEDGRQGLAVRRGTGRSRGPSARRRAGDRQVVHRGKRGAGATERRQRQVPRLPSSGDPSQIGGRPEAAWRSRRAWIWGCNGIPLRCHGDDVRVHGDRRAVDRRGGPGRARPAPTRPCGWWRQDSTSGPPSRTSSPTSWCSTCRSATWAAWRPASTSASRPAPAHARIPVLMLLDRGADVFLARPADADGWLIKPLDAYRLRAAADALLAEGQWFEQPNGTVATTGDGRAARRPAPSRPVPTTPCPSSRGPARARTGSGDPLDRPDGRGARPSVERGSLRGRGAVACSFPIGLWRSLVARCVRDAEVPGSNPGSPTIAATPTRHLQAGGHSRSPPARGGATVWGGDRVDVLAANQAFYDAHEQRDLGAMGAVWEHSDRVVCIHPDGPSCGPGSTSRSRGGASSPARAGTSSSSPTTWSGRRRDGLGHLRREPGRPGRHRHVAATNLFRRADDGWKLVVHHGSPVLSLTARRPVTPPARPAVDVDRRPGDVRRGVGGEEAGQVGELDGLAHAAERDRLPGALHEGVEGQSGARSWWRRCHWSVTRTPVLARSRDAVRGHLPRQALRQCHARRPAHRRRARAGARRLGRHVEDVDDPPPLLRLHGGRHSRTRRIRGEQLQLEVVVPLLVGDDSKGPAADVPALLTRRRPGRGRGRPGRAPHRARPGP